MNPLTIAPLGLLSAAQMPMIPDPSVLATMSHADLYNLRHNLPPDLQAVVAPYEHQAFAREWAKESPVTASLSLPFAIPAYTAAKAMGLLNTRSPASWSEIGQGYTGLIQGLLGQ